jgi:hypothetical protein
MAFDRYRRSRTVTAFAPDIDKLRDLDDGMRRAWAAYKERLRELTGAEYEQAETLAWDELQIELRRLERRRSSLQRTAR